MRLNGGPRVRVAGAVALGLSLACALTAVGIIAFGRSTSGTAGTITPEAVLDSATPPSLPSGVSARQALVNTQADLGTRLGPMQWSLVGSPPVTTALNSVDALDNAHIWAVGASCAVIFSGDGTTWAKDTHAPACGAALNGVFVQDPNHAYAVGSGGTVLVCGNNCNQGTATWTALSGSGIPPSVSFASVWAAGPNTVYAVGSSGGAGVIWACSNSCGSAVAGAGPGKSTWVAVTPAGLTGTPLTGVSGSGGNLAIAVGAQGTILVCAAGNCGASAWAHLSGSPVPSATVSFSGVFVADSNHAEVVGAGVIWACSNKCNSALSGTGGGNASWADITPAALGSTALAAVTDPGGNAAWAVGNAGAIWYCPTSCTAGGTYWVATPSGATAVNLNGVSNSDPTHAWIVGNGGAILNNTANSPTISALNNSVGSLGGALVPALWTNPDGNHVDSKQGDDVFDGTKQAEQGIAGIKSPPSWVMADINSLVGAARLLASTAIADNSCSPQKANELTNAQNELVAGDSEYAKGNYDGAIDHYKHAWEHALKAQGVACAGFTVTPTGVLFSITKMVPGDHPSVSPVTVQVTGSPGSVYIYNSGTSSTCTGTCSPSFADELQLLIVDNTTSKTVYSGPLDQLPGPPPAPAPTTGVQVCGTAGTCTPWTAGEQHNFTFIVTFPSGGGNTYQGAGATASWTWART